MSPLEAPNNKATMSCVLSSAGRQEEGRGGGRRGGGTAVADIPSNGFDISFRSTKQ